MRYGASQEFRTPWETTPHWRQYVPPITFGCPCRINHMIQTIFHIQFIENECHIVAATFELRYPVVMPKTTQAFVLETLQPVGIHASSVFICYDGDPSGHKADLRDGITLEETGKEARTTHYHIGREYDRFICSPAGFSVSAFHRVWPAEL